MIVEHELLCLLARTELFPNAAARVKTLSGRQPDWDGFMRTAARHRVLPLVYRQLKALGPDEVPAPVFSWARDLFLLNAGRNLRLSVRLKEICRHLRKRGMEAVPFKGPVLAQEVFGDVALRQFTDLDVLIPKQAAWTAAKELESRGFVPEIRLSASQFRSYAARNKSLPMIHPGEGVYLDLHWDLSGDYGRAAMTYQAFEQALEPVELLGERFHTLGRADLLIYLCLHAVMESWTRLDHVCCIAELLRKHPEVLCDETYEKAKGLHLRRCLLAGCGLAFFVLDAPIPSFLKRQIDKDGHVRDYIRECRKRLFDTGLPENDAGEKPKFSGRHMLLKEGPGDRFRHLLFLLVSPTIEDWRRMPVPGGLGWVLYGYRPLRLGMKFLRGRIGPPLKPETNRND